MLSEAEELAALRIDQSAPATVQGIQLRAKTAGMTQAAALRSVLQLAEA